MAVQDQLVAWIALVLLCLIVFTGLAAGIAILTKLVSLFRRGR